MNSNNIETECVLGENDISNVVDQKLVFGLHNELTKLILIDKKLDEASEIIADEIKEQCHIYTIRDDENSEMWIYVDGIYVPNAKSYIREICGIALKELYSIHISNIVIDKIIISTYVDKDKFFNQNIVNEVPVLNGILNVITKEKTNFTPDKVFFAKLPITYDPFKTCDNIRKHFETVLKNPEYSVNTMFELFGYLLYKENKFEKAVMFTGDGSNGKSKTIELMRKFIGFENCSSVALQTLSTERFSVYRLHCKMANMCGDIPSTPIKETSMFKALTGRDGVDADRKFKDSIDFVNYAKLIFSANRVPDPYDDSDAFWRRWLFFEFPYEFIKRKQYEKKTIDERKNFRVGDENIIKKLSTSDELSGLLNESLIGLERLLTNKDFSDRTTKEQIRDTWIRKSDSFKSFTMDMIEYNIMGKIAKSKLQEKYIEYCQKHNIKIITSPKKVKNILESSFGARDDRLILEPNKPQTYCWVGISFKNKEK